MPKRSIIITSVLCVIALALGYWSGQGKEEVASSSDVKSSEKKEPEFLKEGLVAYYPFNGNAKDESGNGNDGEIFGNSKFIARGGFSAFEFDGETYISVKYNNLFNALPMTITAWVFDKDGARFSSSINNYATGSWNGWHLSTGNKLASPIYLVSLNEGIGDGSLGQGFKNTPYRTPTPSNVWYHITFVVNNDRSKTFINGVESSSQSWFGTPRRTTNNDPLTMGKIDHTNLCVGKLDDVRIYNRTLSDEEVKALYDFEKAN